MPLSSLPFHQSINHQNMALAKIMLMYGRQQSTNRRGLTAYDLAFTDAVNGNDEPLKFLLPYLEGNLPDGPYDPVVAKDVVQLIEQHNQKMDRIHGKQFSRPRLGKPWISQDKRAVMTPLQSDHYQIVSKIVLSKDPPKSQREQIRQLFYDTFEVWMEGSDQLTEKQRQQKMSDYFDSKFPCQHDYPVFVELCEHQGKVVSAFSAAIKHADHPNHGKFIVVAGKIAVVDKEYTSLGLANIYFRILSAVKKLYPNIPVYNYFKAAPPGNSYNLIDVVNQRVWPKHDLATADLRRVIIEEISGDKQLEPEDGIANARCFIRRKSYNTAKLSEFHLLRQPTHPETSNPEIDPIRAGLNIIFEIEDPDEACIQRLKYNGLTDDHVVDLARTLQQLIGFTKSKEKIGYQQFHNKRSSDSRASIMFSSKGIELESSSITIGPKGKLTLGPNAKITFGDRAFTPKL